MSRLGFFGGFLILSTFSLSCQKPFVEIIEDRNILNDRHFGILVGKIINSRNRLPIRGAKVDFYFTQTKPMDSHWVGQSDTNGFFRSPLKNGKYLVTTSKLENLPKSFDGQIVISNLGPDYPGFKSFTISIKKPKNTLPAEYLFICDIEYYLLAQPI